MAYWLSGSSSVFRGDQLQDGDAVERPAVRPGHGGELGLGLREGDVEARLAEPDALEEVLEGQGRLPRAGVALDEVDPVGGEAAAQDIVQPRNPRRDQATLVSIFGAHSPLGLHRVLIKDAWTHTITWNILRIKGRRDRSQNRPSPVVSIKSEITYMHLYINAPTVP